MKQHKMLKRWGLALLALLLGLCLVLSACSAEEVDLALDVAEALLQEGESLPEETPPAPSVEEKTEAQPNSPPPVETPAEEELPAEEEESPSAEVEEGQPYSSPEEVAAYLHLYGQLPPNYIRKKDAQALGWDSQKGNLWEVTEQMSIGGDRFGNYEGALPDAPGRSWKECDVNYQGGYRGAERLLYSSDGLIYYTDDHYKTFTQLY